MPGIYIHVPFCKKACHYCNFHFSTQLQLKSDLVAAICKEAVLRKTFLQETVDTIYFGGGTPSLLSGSELEILLNTLNEHYTIAPNAEITLEANPDDIDPKTLNQWHQAGINRLSIGIQSFFEEDLQWMNRAHNAQQANHCIELAQTAGFYNLTIDLIYGTPGLTNERWKQNIETALTLGIPHLSCYALTVEPNTALDVMVRKGTKEEVDADHQAIHFNILTETLQNAGFEHYEISNFAKPGFRSKHNSSYWQGNPYLGLGPSAHSFDGHVTRQWNISNNPLYISSLQQGIIPFESEMLTMVQRINEYLMTSLRTIEGISLNFLEKNWGEERKQEVLKAAQIHVVQQNIQLQEQHIILTAQGKFLADGIAADLFVE
ncbi:MAG: radical SAM family heme chaperone HemW [Sediminibacterium sp.]|uniref:radical SAM family heme chaperone HemW n=1 Tax=Sediminibacterium sp. TaxID=1917865 RepID=UPI002ABBA979|nr:radical SAM family heme chaperone HemW [Sediminibacterium sp.]MDZ4072005.1 radical SAM family heme chaperone HemW [Sediminibacterium sp.]